MKTWGRFFRRRSQTTKALKEDYPTHSDSDVTDDETRRREWENHLNRRATNAGPAAHLDDLNNWDVQSEYDFTFPSESSIMEAYQEGKYNRNLQDDDEFEKVLKDAVSYERKYSGERNGGGGIRFFLHANDVERNPTKAQQMPARSPRVSERIRDLEDRQNAKRRASCAPQANLFDKQHERNRYADRYATWNDNGAKRKVKKNAKHRKRANAHEFPFDGSDDDSKYTVNLTMEDLNSIIKKNINSAVKAIISATTKGNKSSLRPVSPTDSFSTETETIFSGSSNQSSDLQPGMLHKQISWQLDVDRLKGARRKSHATGQMQSNVDTGQHAFHDNRRLSLGPHQIPRIDEIPASPNVSPRQDSEHLYIHQPQQQIVQPISQPSQIPIPPPPPPPPPPVPSHLPTAQPQVTFNLTPQQPTSFPGIASPMQFQQNSVFPGNAMSNFRSSTDYGDPSNQPIGDQSNFGSRYKRRHTLASLDTEDLLATTESALDAKVEQLNNVLNFLDKNIRQAEADVKPSSSAENTNSNGETKAQSASGSGTTTRQDSVDINPAPQVVSIADQIAALTKKKKKVLKPGQIRMSSCARALLVLTNIAFLIIGGAGVGLGIWLMMDPNIDNYFALVNVDQTNQDFKSICYALIGVGAFIFSIAFTGCCGTIKSSRCLLTAFLVMIVIIAVAEAGLGVIVFLHLDSPTAIPVLSAMFSNMENNLRTMLTRSIVEKYDPVTLIGSTWNLVQIQLECCGASGPDDYKLSAWKNVTTNELTIPDECCVLISKDAEVPEPSNKLLCQVETVGFFHDTGCFDVMMIWFKTNSKYIIAAGLSSIAIEIIAFICAVIICQKGKQTVSKEGTST